MIPYRQLPSIKPRNNNKKKGTTTKCDAASVLQQVLAMLRSYANKPCASEHTVAAAGLMDTLRIAATRMPCYALIVRATWDREKAVGTRDGESTIRSTLELPTTTPARRLGRLQLSRHDDKNPSFRLQYMPSLITPHHERPHSLRSAAVGGIVNSSGNTA